MTGIPYVQETCNAVLGCTKCSPACENCWAIGTVKRLMECHRFKGNDLAWKYDAPLNGDRKDWSGKAVVDFNAFSKCCTKTPKTFLLSSLGDWLHESLSTAQINALLDEMRQYSWHRFYTLTKRPERWKELGPIPSNVWLGASVWDQGSYDKAIQCRRELKHPCADWLSMEPLLGPIDISYYGWLRDWIVVGCESGKNRRRCNQHWIRYIVKMAHDFRIPCFVKQLDIEGKVSTDPLEWPEDLRVQEMPKVERAL